MGGLPPGQVRIFLACLLVFGCGQASDQDARATNERIAPLPTVTCDRNQLTSWFGVVSGYHRESDSTWIQITTDYDTVEELTLDHADREDASGYYRLKGEPFKESDWQAIEQSPGILVPGMRITAWICEDGKTAPLIDWQPPQE